MARTKPQHFKTKEMNFDIDDLSDKKYVVKRDGDLDVFLFEKIQTAIANAMRESGVEDFKLNSFEVASMVHDRIEEEFYEKDMLAHVEEIQDIIEEELMLNGFTKTAKNYILYREQRRQERTSFDEEDDVFDKGFISKYKHKPSPFPTELGKFIFYRTYSRWLPDKERREYWWQSVRRAVDYNISLAKTYPGEAEDLYDAVYNHEVFLAGKLMPLAA